MWKPHGIVFRSLSHSTLIFRRESPQNRFSILPQSPLIRSISFAGNPLCDEHSTPLYPCIYKRCVSREIHTVFRGWMYHTTGRARGSCPRMSEIYELCTRGFSATIIVFPSFTLSLFLSISLSLSNLCTLSPSFFLFCNLFFSLSISFFLLLSLLFSFSLSLYFILFPFVCSLYSVFPSHFPYICISIVNTQAQTKVYNAEYCTTRRHTLSCVPCRPSCTRTIPVISENPRIAEP